MSRRLRLGILSGLFLLLLCPTTESNAQQIDSAGLRFLWAFGAVVGSEGSRDLISIEKDAVLHSGDRLKILFEPQTSGHFYLIYQSSQGELTLLFPNDLSDSSVSPPAQIAIPAGDLWFKLDAVTGTERFYLIASTRRLNEFEKRFQELAAETPQTITRPEAVQALLSEIKALNRRHRKLTAQAERPVRLGGNFRGTGQEKPPTELYDISRIAVEISAPEFYSRTFTIDHR